MKQSSAKKKGLRENLQVIRKKKMNTIFLKQLLMNKYSIANWLILVPQQHKFHMTE